MYTKEELLSKDVVELMDIAHGMDIKVSQDDDIEKVVYAILDKDAENASMAPAKKKRNRITPNNKVYTVNGKEGENFDVKKKSKPAEAPQPALFAEMPPEKHDEPQAEEPPTDAPAPKPMTADEIAAAFPKHRGRKSKAELAAIAAMQEAQRKAAEEAAKPTEPAEEPEPQPQSEPQQAESEEDQQAMIRQLQEKMAQHNEASRETTAESGDEIWEGDPGDGTDFIPVIDVPIEDNEALPTLDMLDRPVIQQQPPQMETQFINEEDQEDEEYDFAGLIGANGVVEILQDGYGFIRSSDYNYLSSPDDIYISPSQIKKYALKTGDVVDCTVCPPHDGEKYFALDEVRLINGRDPMAVRDRVAFEHLTPLFPDEKFRLCGDPQTTNPSVRLVDLFSPIGKGQRALIVAQPKTGKTILMKDVANAIAANHPEAYLMMLLIDERPEEVTDMSRTVNAEVIASTFDEPAERHVKIAGIVLEKAKRMVECGHDVVIFLDSITRLARAYNTVSPASGKVLTGGVDANALQKPKRFFGAARNIENGGSLTIIATALIDTGSKMDEVIFEEFKGTGNMELQLDRALSNKRIFPSINLVQSSTRRDDLLQDQTTLNRMWIIRKFISEMNPIEAMNTIRERLVQTRDNEEFLLAMNG